MPLYGPPWRPPGGGPVVSATASQTRLEKSTIKSEPSGGHLVLVISPGLQQPRKCLLRPAAPSLFFVFLLYILYRRTSSPLPSCSFTALPGASHPFLPLREIKPVLGHHCLRHRTRISPTITNVNVSTIAFTPSLVTRFDVKVVSALATKEPDTKSAIQ